jgi:hypothetical protein
VTNKVKNISCLPRQGEVFLDHEPMLSRWLFVLAMIISYQNLNKKQSIYASDHQRVVIPYFQPESQNPWNDNQLVIS